MGLPIEVRFRDTVPRNSTRPKRQSELQNFALGPDVSFPKPTIASQIIWIANGRRISSEQLAKRRGIHSRMLPTLITDCNPHEATSLGALRNIDLFGYWITPLFFELHRAALESHLRLKTQLPDRLERIALQGSAQDSIAIHARRGDYFSGDLESAYGLLGPSYYETGSKLLAENAHMAHPKIFIFTDDAKWANAMLTPKLNFAAQVTIVEQLAMENSAQHLNTMSQFQNLVLSNSTFSWWAASLGASKAGVVSPKSWGIKLGDAALLGKDWILT